MPEAIANCAMCGRPFLLRLLDAKPHRLAGPGDWDKSRLRIKALRRAMDRNEDFDRLECRRCYGPGWREGVG